MNSRKHKNTVLSKIAHSSSKALALNNTGMGWGQYWRVILGQTKDFSKTVPLTQFSLERFTLHPSCHPATLIQRRHRDAEFGQMQQTILNKSENISRPQTYRPNTLGSVSVLQRTGLACNWHFPVVSPEKKVCTAHLICKQKDNLRWLQK